MEVVLPISILNEATEQQTRLEDVMYKIGKSMLKKGYKPKLV